MFSVLYCVAVSCLCHLIFDRGQSLVTAYLNADQVIPGSNPSPLTFLLVSHNNNSILTNLLFCGPSGRAVQGVGLRPLACWDCWFESHRGHGCLVYCECCMLSGRCLCDGLITRPEESYRLWCVVVCDLEISWMRSWTAGGRRAENKQTHKHIRLRRVFRIWHFFFWQS